jgi:two-component system, OmpR family, heavy metal sensor histidine kinase CusS
LIENGCRYGSSWVMIGIERRHGAVMLRVQDDGPGVPESDRERIFEPGWRGGGSRSEANPEGAGLGLPLARRLARAAGGDVQSEAGVPGGRFTARLPVG